MPGLDIRQLADANSWPPAVPNRVRRARAPRRRRRASRGAASARCDGDPGKDAAGPRPRGRPNRSRRRVDDGHEAARPVRAGRADRRAHARRNAAWGTCMGMIVAAHDVAGLDQPTLDLIDIRCAATPSAGRTIRRKSISRSPRLGSTPFPGHLHSRALDRTDGPGGGVTRRARRTRRDGARGQRPCDLVPPRAGTDARAPPDTSWRCGSKGRLPAAA